MLFAVDEADEEEIPHDIEAGGLEPLPPAAVEPSPQRVERGRRHEGDIKDPGYAERKIGVLDLRRALGRMNDKERDDEAGMDRHADAEDDAQDPAVTHEQHAQ